MRPLHGVLWGLSVLLAARWPAAADTLQAPQVLLEKGLEITPCAAHEGDPGPALHTGLSCLHSTVRLGNVSAAHRVRFLYYDPGGDLYLATRADWTVQPTGGAAYHRTGLVRHRMLVAGERASLMPGDWKAAVWLDGLTVSELTFSLGTQQAVHGAAHAEIRELYMDLRYEEALQRADDLSSWPGALPAVHTEALWWLALTQSALEQGPQVESTLLRLLETDPAFSPDPNAVNEAGGAGVARRLEELRVRRHPELYRKTNELPRVELSPAEEPPVIGRRRRWYQRWWLYAGIAAVAIPATALLAGGGSTVEEPPGPPNVSLDMTGEKHFFGDEFLCEGELMLQLRIDGGKAPFEVLYTAAASQASLPVRLEGAPQRLGTEDVVLLRKLYERPGAFAEPSPRLQVEGPNGTTVVLLRFGVIVKDAGTSASFEGSATGGLVPAAVLDLPGRDPRVVQQQILRTLANCDP